MYELTQLDKNYIYLISLLSVNQFELTNAVTNELTYTPSEYTPSQNYIEQVRLCTFVSPDKDDIAVIIKCVDKKQYSLADPDRLWAEHFINHARPISPVVIAIAAAIQRRQVCLYSRVRDNGEHVVLPYPVRFFGEELNLVVYADTTRFLFFYFNNFVRDYGTHSFHNYGKNITYGGDGYLTEFFNYIGEPDRHPAYLPYKKIFRA